MDNLARLLLRFLLVPLGYVCAVVAGSAVVLIGEWRIGDLYASGVPEESGLGLLVAIAASAFLLVMLAVFMWLVAAVGILFSELFAIRSWMFHAANGVVSAWIGSMMLVSRDTPEANAVAGDPFYIVAAGLAAGLAYWLVAGSTAGFFKPILRAPAERLTRLPPPPPPSLPPASLPPPA